MSSHLQRWLLSGTASKLISFPDHFLLNCFRFLVLYTVYNGGLAVLYLSHSNVMQCMVLLSSLSGVTRVVSPGAATQRVTPIFSWKKTDDHFSHHPYITVCYFCGVTPIYFLLKNWRLFCSSLSLLLISLRCHRLESVTRGGPPSDATAVAYLPQPWTETHIVSYHILDT